MHQLICRVVSIARGYEIQQILDEGGCPELKISNLQVILCVLSAISLIKHH